MKNILIYGDSNSWGNIAGSFNPETMLHQRYEYDARWPGILQKLLGADYHVIEACLNGRNTSFDEIGFFKTSRNGLAAFSAELDAHYPLDLVIFMLGTNDVKIPFNANVKRIVDGMRGLVRTAKASCFGRNGQAPHILLISPAPICVADYPLYKELFDLGSVEKSRQLAAYYAKLAEEEGCAFMDAAPYVKISAKDGIHLEQDSHETLAKAVVEKIQREDTCKN